MDTNRISGKLFYSYTDTILKSKQSKRPYGEWSTEHRYTLDSLSRSKPKTVYWDTVNIYGNVNLSRYWAVVVRYSTGDTFGTASGRGCCFAVFEDEQEALAIKARIECNVDYDSDEPRDSLEEFEEYKPWQGYFESVQSCHVVSMSVD